MKSGSVAVDQSAAIELPEAAPGTWYLRVEPLSGSAVVSIANRASAEIATAEEPLKLFNSHLTRYFHVPAGSRGFRIGYRDGGPDETARIQVTSPLGRVALSIEGNSRGTDYPVEVREGEADGIWQLRIEPRQDMMLWLAGEATPYLSDHPARVLRER
ncbi:MAG: hypothetical protein HUU35_12530 [Armatimonadetes bacterium]|nr:hypothetical protein [Armatimonadota bacterium]